MMTAAVFFIAGFENRGAANAATLYDLASERHLEFYEVFGARTCENGS